jgi:hypothetical protein
MLQVLGTFLVGAIGWFAANFFGKPWIEFRALRKEIQEELTFSVNDDLPSKLTLFEHGDEVYNDEKKRFYDAQKNIRLLGSKLSALNTSLYRPLSYLLQTRGYKLNDAARNLLWLSKQFDADGRALTRCKIEVALRLPHLEQRWVQSMIEMQEAAALRRQEDPEWSP